MERNCSSNGHEHLPWRNHRKEDFARSLFFPFLTLWVLGCGATSWSSLSSWGKVWCLPVSSCNTLCSSVRRCATRPSMIYVQMIGFVLFTRPISSLLSMEVSRSTTNRSKRISIASIDSSRSWRSRTRNTHATKIWFSSLRFSRFGQMLLLFVARVGLHDAILFFTSTNLF